MISRQWCGLAKPAHLEANVEHLRKETFPELAKIPGFVDASISRCNVPGSIEVRPIWELKQQEPRLADAVRA